MTFLIVFLFLISYIYYRKARFSSKKISTIGGIERVFISSIEPDIILPEVKIKYKYYYEKGVYFGYSYVLLADLIDTPDYEIYFNHYGEPVLEIGDLRFISEEHIESCLLELYDKVTIYLDPVEPYHSQLASLMKKEYTLDFYKDLN